MVKGKNKVMKIATIVVTYNRKQLLQECLQAIMNQTVLPDKIFVINNASTDGTEKLFDKNARFFSERIQLLNMEENLGGAGGFYEGIKYVSQGIKEKYDWIWIMDDDTIPNSEALEEMVKSISEFQRLNVGKISYLASSVYGPKNEPMNVPGLYTKPTSNGYSDWYMTLEQSLIRISTATFVSILINIKAIDKVGYPLKEYFLWGDDMEYTNRLTSYYGNAYLCGKSKVLHKRNNAKAISIEHEDNKNRIDLFGFYYRNILTNYKMYYGKNKALKVLISFEIKSIKMLLNKKINYRFKKFIIVQMGIMRYFRENKMLIKLRDSYLKE